MAPAELEDVLMHCPGVADAAVVGVPDPVSGELPKAFIVKESHSSVSEQDIKSYVAGE